ncbi:MAG TPA: hypothetical protein VF163_17195, partial [Micromonosporaceae bacterium]
APRGWIRTLGAAVAAGPLAGLVLALTSTAAAGSLGSGQLSVLGADAWPVAVITAGLVAAGVLLGATVARLLDSG